MQNVLLVVHLLACISLVITVMLQRSEGGALGMGGGGTGGIISGRGAANVLVRVTMICAAIFFTTSIVMTRLNAEDAQQPSDLQRQIQQQGASGGDPLGSNPLAAPPPAGTTPPATTTAPATPDPLAPATPSATTPPASTPAPAPSTTTATPPAQAPASTAPSGAKPAPAPTQPASTQPDPLAPANN